MIEDTLNITMKGRMNTLLQKGMLHVLRTALYFVGILFLESSNSFPQKNIAACKRKVYFESNIFAKLTLLRVYLVDECLIVCMDA